jgi:hypothetical protein
MIGMSGRAVVIQMEDDGSSKRRYRYLAERVATRPTTKAALSFVLKSPLEKHAPIRPR